MSQEEKTTVEKRIEKLEKDSEETWAFLGKIFRISEKRMEIDNLKIRINNTRDNLIALNFSWAVINSIIIIFLIIRG